MSHIINAYHGSCNKFETFDFTEVGLHSGTSGAGFGLYFTESKAEALAYGDIVYSVILKLKSAISNDEVTLKPVEVKKLVEYNLEVYGKSYYEQFGYENATEEQKNDVIEKLVANFSSDTKIICDLIDDGISVNQMMQTMCNFNYTHTTDKESADIDNIMHYIVYDLNVIQLLECKSLQEIGG